MILRHAITIRPLEPEDAPSLFEAARESAAELFPWLPWCHPRYSITEAEQWALSRPRLFERGREYSFAITNAAGRFLGGCGLNQINGIHRFANLGYWVRTSEMGKGVAALAVGELARFAFSETELVRLEIVCAIDNRRSQRVAEKAGATREGVLRDRLLLPGGPRDAVIYSIVKSERAQTRPPQL